MTNSKIKNTKTTNDIYPIKLFMKKSFFVIYFFISIFFINKSIAISENFLDYRVNHALISWFESNFISGTFTTQDKLKLTYKKLTIRNPKGALIFIHGKSEFSYKYAELFYDIANWGYDIYFLDQRGYGESDRATEKTKFAYIDDFNKYITDYVQFIDLIIPKNKYSKKILIAHSMGGAVATGVTEKKPGYFDKMFLTSPMFKINTFDYSESQILFYLAGLKIFGKAKDLIPISLKKLGPTVKKEFKLTSSVNRFESYLNLIKEKPYLTAEKATVGWSYESIYYTVNLRQKENFLTLPTLILQAEKDIVVDPSGHQEMCDKNLHFCHIIKMTNAHHELFWETDAIRDQVIRYLYEFITY